MYASTQENMWALNINIGQFKHGLFIGPSDLACLINPQRAKS